MKKSTKSAKTSRTSQGVRQVEEIDPQEVQARLKTIDLVLRMRFSDYSPDFEALAPLGAMLDLATLDDVFAKACRAKTFQSFCASVGVIWKEYSARIEKERVAPKIILAQAFNNHVATVLGSPGKITAQFLEMCARQISPELADRLDFKNAKSEPTVFVFGNNVSRICDLLFSIPYKDDHDCYFPIVVLMEHKSTPDRNVAKQMLISLTATLDFMSRYPERFRTPDGKTVWPFVVLFYTGAKKWDVVPNLPDLFTTTSEDLDRRWIFKLKFLLVSLVDKRLVATPEDDEDRQNAKKLASFDEAILPSNWLTSFFEFLRRAELASNNPKSTREGWLADVGASLRPLKDVYDPNDAQDARALDVSLSFVGTMCAKMNFETPSREELTTIMANEGIGGMITTSRLIYAAEREEGRIEGIIEGERNGRIEGERNGRIAERQSILSQLISLRFPTATPRFVKRLVETKDESYAKELVAIALAASTLDEFKKKVKTLKPAC